MSDKKHHHHKSHPDAGDEVAAAAGEVEQGSGPDLTSPESEAAANQELRAALAEAETKAAENLDGWQRSLAEFQNYKKRVERDREIDQANMKSDLIRKILPILDDLERALQNRPPDDAWASGVELIQRKLQAILDGEGVRRMEADGAVFDPNLHEAIALEPVDGAESGRVVAVLQNGYTLGERVIRPAQVKVAK